MHLNTARDYKVYFEEQTNSFKHPGMLYNLAFYFLISCNKQMCYLVSLIKFHKKKMQTYNNRNLLNKVGVTKKTLKSTLHTTKRCSYKTEYSTLINRSKVFHLH